MRSKVWLDDAESMALPVSGAGWDGIESAAAKATASPNLSDQKAKMDVYLMARALKWQRTSRSGAERDAIAQLCMGAMGSEVGSRSLALGWSIPGLLIAADTIALRDRAFLEWARVLRLSPTTDGPKNLVECQEVRGNNWSTGAGGARAVIDAFLWLNDDPAYRAEAMDDGLRCWEVHRGWMGDREAYAGFKWSREGISGDDRSWHANEAKPVGINPRGSTIDGHNVDGVLPDDRRRGGGFRWPPPTTGDGAMYPWTGLQGAVLCSAICARLLGPSVWNEQESAILRAVRWETDVALNPAVGDDTWIPWVINKAYRGAKRFATKVGTVGKVVMGTDWTHAE